METSQKPERNKETVRRLYIDILNKRRLDLLDQIFSEEYINVQGDKGPVGFERAANSMTQAFPDIQWTIEDLIAEGDKVMVKWFWEGTNTGSFNGFPPSNQFIKHTAVVIFDFEDEKVVKNWMLFDRLSFFQQMGILSPELTNPPVKR